MAASLGRKTLVVDTDESGRRSVDQADILKRALYIVFNIARMLKR